MNGLQKVFNCQVNWVCCLVSKDHNLSLSEEIIIGIIVAPGLMLLIAFCFYLIFNNCSDQQKKKNLGAPPPLIGLHLMINPNGFIGIGIMSFWRKKKVLRVLRVTIE